MQPARLAARRTIYRGIEMRSRLEARYAAWLDTWGEGPWCKRPTGKPRWQYEPHVYAGAAGQWLPDFYVAHVMTSWNGRREMLVDVKRPSWDADPVEKWDLLQRMAVVYDSEPDAVLVIEEGDPSRGVTHLVELDEDGVPALTEACWLNGRHGLVLGRVEMHPWARWDAA